MLQLALNPHKFVLLLGEPLLNFTSFAKFLDHLVLIFKFDPFLKEIFLELLNLLQFTLQTGDLDALRLNRVLSLQMRLLELFVLLVRLFLAEDHFEAGFQLVHLGFSLISFLLCGLQLVNCCVFLFQGLLVGGVLFL